MLSEWVLIHILTGIFANARSTTVFGGTFSVAHQTIDKFSVCSVSFALLHIPHFGCFLEVHVVSSSLFPNSAVILVKCYN